MNMRMRFCLGVLSALGLSASSLADQPGALLFQDLSEADRLTAEQLNPYFIKKYTRSAGRYRLVRVNPEILDDAEYIAIPLFDGEVLELKRTRTVETPAIGGLRWEGISQYGVPPAKDYQSLGGALSEPAVAERVHRAQFTVQLSSALYWRDKESQANLASVSQFFSGDKSPDEDRMGLRKAGADFIVGVSARFSRPSSESAYGLELLGMGGPYHVLWEESPEKRRPMSDAQIIFGSDGQLVAVSRSSEVAPEEDSTAETNQRIDISLGKNPHDEIYERLLLNRAGDK